MRNDVRRVICGSAEFATAILFGQQLSESMPLRLEVEIGIPRGAAAKQALIGSGKGSIAR